MKDLTVRRLGNTDFEPVYIDFLLNQECDSKKIQLMLSLAIIFLNSENKNIYELGYRIIIIYTNRYKNYCPLYEISINKGLIPISSLIENNILKERTNLTIEWNKIYSEQFFFNNIYLSLQQVEMNEFYLNNQNKSVTIVAPTSYGKTELIIQSVKNCTGNIVIITPTKALLTQTKSRILSHIEVSRKCKVISHPDMLNGKEEKIIAVLTQERLLKLLKDYDIFFDIVVVDEAHTLLSNTKRSQLLADVLVILKKQNNNIKFKLFTPFLFNPQNLNMRYCNIEFAPFSINEKMKTEIIYYADFKEEKC